MSKWKQLVSVMTLSSVIGEIGIIIASFYVFFSIASGTALLVARDAFLALNIILLPLAFFYALAFVLMRTHLLEVHRIARAGIVLCMLLLTLFLSGVMLWVMGVTPFFLDYYATSLEVLGPRMEYVDATVYAVVGSLFVYYVLSGMLGTRYFLCCKKSSVLYVAKCVLLAVSTVLYFLPLLVISLWIFLHGQNIASLLLAGGIISALSTVWILFLVKDFGDIKKRLLTLLLLAIGLITSIFLLLFVVMSFIWTTYTWHSYPILLFVLGTLLGYIFYAIYGMQTKLYPQKRPRIRTY